MLHLKSSKPIWIVGGIWNVISDILCILAKNRIRIYRLDVRVIANDNRCWWFFFLARFDLVREWEFTVTEDSSRNHSQSFFRCLLSGSRAHTEREEKQETESLRLFRSILLRFNQSRRKNGIMIIVCCSKSLYTSFCNNNNRHNYLGSFTQPYHFHILHVMLWCSAE